MQELLSPVSRVLIRLLSHNKHAEQTLISLDRPLISDTTPLNNSSVNITKPERQLQISLWLPVPLSNPGSRGRGLVD
jgi:hypothetical protein